MPNSFKWHGGEWGAGSNFRPYFPLPSSQRSCTRCRSPHGGGGRCGACSRATSVVRAAPVQCVGRHLGYTSGLHVCDTDIQPPDTRTDIQRARKCAGTAAYTHSLRSRTVSPTRRRTPPTLAPCTFHGHRHSPATRAVAPPCSFKGRSAKTPPIVGSGFECWGEFVGRQAAVAYLPTQRSRSHTPSHTHACACARACVRAACTHATRTTTQIHPFGWCACVHASTLRVGVPACPHRIWMQPCRHAKTSTTRVRARVRAHVCTYRRSERQRSETEVDCKAWRPSRPRTNPA